MPPAVRSTLGAVEYRSWISDSRRWDGFAFRPGDIVISTPPKCGTTWTQMLCGLLIFDGPDFPGPLDQVSPWVDQTNRPIEDVKATLAAQEHRRFLKTHTPLDGIPWHDQVTYLVVGRDPRDVAISWHHHRHNIDVERLLAQRAAALGENDDIGPPTRPPPPATPTETFQDFLDATDAIPPVPSLRNMLHHYDTGWQLRGESNVGLFHYNDYQANIAGEVRRLANLLAIDVTPARADELAGMSHITNIREDAANLAPNATDGFLDPSQFFRSGGSAQWRTIVTADQVVQYDMLVSSLVPPDLASWAHRGRAASRVAGS
jgi:hypothetical protein